MTESNDNPIDATTNPGQGTSDTGQDLQTRAKDAWDSVQQRTKSAVREGSAYARENPVPVAIAAFAFGVVFGLLLRRRAPASFTDRYIAVPLHQSRDALLGYLNAGGTLAKRTFSSASSAAGELAGNVGDGLKDSLKPLKKAAQQTGRKLGLCSALLFACGLLALSTPYL